MLADFLKLYPQGALAPVRAGRPRQRARRGARWPSATTCDRVYDFDKARRSSRSTPTSWRAARAACATPATSPTAAACATTGATMNRLYAVESTPTAHRRDGRPPPAAAAEPSRGVRPGAGASWASARRGERTTARPGVQASWLERAGRRPASATAARSLVVAGEAQPPAVHALAHAMNEALGNVGQDGALHRAGGGRPDRRRPARCASWSTTWPPARSRLLLILGGNPVYNAPADLEFADGARQGAAARPPGPVRRRDLAHSATGTSPRPTTWKPGATPAPTTARSRSCSR